MSFTYNIVKLETDKIAQVRLATGQTQAPSKVSDEEIKFILSQHNQNVPLASKTILKNLLVAFSQEHDSTTGEVSESKSQVYENLKDLLANTSVGAGAFDIPVGIHFGGIDSEEFDVRNRDKTVYHGFRAEDKEAAKVQVCGVEILDITEDQASEEQGTFTLEFLVEDWVQSSDSTKYKIEITKEQHGLFVTSISVLDDTQTIVAIANQTADNTVTLSVALSPDERFIGSVEISGLKPSRSKVVLDEC